MSERKIDMRRENEVNLLWKTEENYVLDVKIYKIYGFEIFWGEIFFLNF